MIKALHYPFNSEGNPYQTLMGQALEANNVEFAVLSGDLKPLFSASFSSSYNILHLHWTHGPANDLCGFKALLGLGVFHCSLMVWRLRRKHIIWTVHNLLNHEKRRIWIDKLNSMVVARLSSRILVHGHSAIPEVQDLFRISDNKLRVVHHGNYAKVVEASPLDLDHEGKRFLFFGMIRPYKGVPDLIDAFQSLNGPFQLHITGLVKQPDLEKQVREEAREDKRITLNLNFVPDDELQRLLAWSDVVVLPYREILTSGSLLMALTAGRPVVVPQAGLIPEYADDQCAFFYDPEEPDGLRSALKEAANATDIPQRVTAAQRRAEQFGWESIGAEIARIYREVTPLSTKTATKKR